MWLAEQTLTRLGVLLTISAWLVSALMARYILVLTRYLSWSSEVAYMEGLRSFNGRETTLVATTASECGAWPISLICALKRGCQSELESPANCTTHCYKVSMA